MGVLGSIFGFGDQIKRNIRDFASNPKDYVEGAIHQNNIEWKKGPVERSLGFFNPVPLGTMGNFVIQKKLEEAATNLSRRDFMKKSAGITGGSAAASIPGAKLLQKFAPEEKAIAKEAVVEAAPKYKYNSLKEYLDDVETKAYAAHDNPVDFHQLGDEFSSISQQMKEQLLRDEARYKSAKNLFKPGGTRDPAVYNVPEGYKSVYKSLDDFSPQAKQEMKELKELSHKLHTDYGGNPSEAPWVDWVANNPGDPQRILEGLRSHATTGVFK